MSVALWSWLAAAVFIFGLYDLTDPVGRLLFNVLVTSHRAGEHSSTELAELFTVARSTGTAPSSGTGFDEAPQPRQSVAAEPPRFSAG